MFSIGGMNTTIYHLKDYAYAQKKEKFESLKQINSIMISVNLLFDSHYYFQIYSEQKWYDILMKIPDMKEAWLQ